MENGEMKDHMGYMRQVLEPVLRSGPLSDYVLSVRLQEDLDHDNTPVLRALVTVKRGGKPFNFEDYLVALRQARATLGSLGETRFLLVNLMGE